MRTTFEMTGLGDFMKQMENRNCIQGEPKENQYSEENRNI